MQAGLAVAGQAETEQMPLWPGVRRVRTPPPSNACIRRRSAAAKHPERPGSHHHAVFVPALVLCARFRFEIPVVALSFQTPLCRGASAAVVEAGIGMALEAEAEQVVLRVRVCSSTSRVRQ
eukprot:1214556-Rhodomonas_salina.2